MDSLTRQRLLKRLLWKVPAILLLVSFAVWWQWRQDQPNRSRPAIAPAEIGRVAAAISGIWQGEVIYGGGDKFTERFFFQTEGDKLYGTASFLGFKRGIEDGRVEKDGVSFNLRYEQTQGSEIRGIRNYYTARLAGSDLTVRLQDSQGTPPLEFKITRIPESG